MANLTLLRWVAFLILQLARVLGILTVEHSPKNALLFRFFLLFSLASFMSFLGLIESVEKACVAMEPNALPLR